MGADGGVAYASLRADLATARALLAPWWDVLMYLGSRDRLTSRLAWINAHDTSRLLVGAYGTDLGDRLATVSDLPAWVDALDDALTEPVRGLPDGATFDDYLDEIDTRPPQSYVYDYLGESERAWINDLRRASPAFRAQSIATWLDAVRRAIMLDVRHEETWT